MAVSNFINTCIRLYLPKGAAIKGVQGGRHDALVLFHVFNGLPAITVLLCQISSTVALFDSQGRPVRALGDA